MCLNRQGSASQAAARHAAYVVRTRPLHFTSSLQPALPPPFTSARLGCLVAAPIFSSLLPLACGRALPRRAAGFPP